MTYEVAIIISVLISALITFFFAWHIEIREAKKRIELLHSISEAFKAAKDLILHMSEEIDNVKAELEELKKSKEEQQ